MSSTNWKGLYGPTILPDTNAHIIVTAPSGVAYVITKFTLTNVSGGAVSATVYIDGVIVAQVTIPAGPVQGGIRELSELEGMTLNSGSAISVQAVTAAAIAPMVSGAAFTA